MSTSEVSKVAVVDPRIVQQRPSYAVEKGALSLTNTTYSAIANSSASQTFNIQVPSENVFVDRAVDWVNTVSAVITFTLGAAPAAGVPLLIPGVDFSLAPFPTTQCVNTMSATINDSTVTINTSDVLPQILRLSDMASARKQRTCPTMLDRQYKVTQSGSNTQAVLAGNGVVLATTQATALSTPVGSYADAFSAAEVPNGAWSGLVVLPPTVGSGQQYTIDAASGLPLSLASAGPYNINVQWTTTEKLVLPPFIFGDEYELSTGLFGVQNIQLTVNMLPTPTRALRISDLSSGTLSPYTAAGVTVAFSQVGSSPFASPRLQVQFLTPPIEVDLPAKSVVPWMEFPRYISPSQLALAGSAVTPVANLLQSQTITLPSIPDLLMIYVKPQSYSTSTVGDWVMPVSQISVNFDNFSGLLASHTQQELYKMSFMNGVDMDYSTWSGSAWGTAGKVTTVGGPLVLRPGRDFPLQSGQAPGLVGNFTFQFSGTWLNSTPYGALPTDYVSIYVVAVNSGFFETIKGSSRIIKGILTETDILGASQVAAPDSLARMVGSAKPKLGMTKKHSPMSAYC
jgi:hypothetical protein